MKPVSSPGLALLFASLFGFTSFAQDDIEITSKVTKADLKIEVEVNGTFVADDRDEIAMEPSKYRGDLIVTKILAEGSSVKQGDVLMEFAKDELDEALEQAENEVTDAEVELKKAPGGTRIVHH